MKTFVSGSQTRTCRVQILTSSCHPQLGHVVVDDQSAAEEPGALWEPQQGGGAAVLAEPVSDWTGSDGGS